MKTVFRWFVIPLWRWEIVISRQEWGVFGNEYFWKFQRKAARKDNK